LVKHEVNPIVNGTIVRLDMGKLWENSRRISGNSGITWDTLDVHPNFEAICGESAYYNQLFNPQEGGSAGHWKIPTKKHLFTVNKMSC
jgi:hypothetical protein